VEKGTQTEYAVKMIDLTQEKDNEDLTEQLRESTKKEMEVLRIGSEHPNISKTRLFAVIFLISSIRTSYFLSNSVICMFAVVVFD